MEVRPNGNVNPFCACVSPRGWRICSNSHRNRPFHVHIEQPGKDKLSFRSSAEDEVAAMGTKCNE